VRTSRASTSGNSGRPVTCRRSIGSSSIPWAWPLEVVQEEDGTERLGGVWDYRDDPEGIYFGEPPDVSKARHIAAEQRARAVIRKAALGYVVQPVTPDASKVGP
jgi:hypothetical protein